MEKPQIGNQKVLDVFLPGMIHAYGYRGRFPAVSITGPFCLLQCAHCKGYLLKYMYYANTPEKLVKLLKKLEKSGKLGALISGGCDKEGKMPWETFLPHLIKLQTSLYLIAHGGLNISKDTSLLFKKADIKQILIDVIGDPLTLKEIYHIDNFNVMEKTLYNVYSHELNVAPHVIIGIYRGKIRGEFDALDMLARFQRKHVILVVLMPNALEVNPPPINDVIKVFTYARKLFSRITLGCARPKGKYRRELEIALIERNLIDAMALWSDQAIERAQKLGYTIRFYEGCCSIELKEHIPILEQFYNIRVFK